MYPYILERGASAVLFSAQAIILSFSITALFASAQFHWNDFLDKGDHLV